MESTPHMAVVTLDVAPPHALWRRLLSMLLAVILLVAPYAPRGAAASSPMARGPDGLIVPHGGGALVDTLVSDAKKQADLVASCNGVTLQLSDRNACDVELLTVGCVPVRNAGA